MVKNIKGIKWMNIKLMFISVVSFISSMVIYFNNFFFSYDPPRHRRCLTFTNMKGTSKCRTLYKAIRRGCYQETIVLSANTTNISIAVSKHAKLTWLRYIGYRDSLCWGYIVTSSDVMIAFTACRICCCSNT